MCRSTSCGLFQRQCVFSIFSVHMFLSVFEVSSAFVSQIVQRLDNLSFLFLSYLTWYVLCYLIAPDPVLIYPVLIYPDPIFIDLLIRVAYLILSCRILSYPFWSYAFGLYLPIRPSTHPSIYQSFHWPIIALPVSKLPNHFTICVSVHLPIHLICIQSHT